MYWIHRSQQENTGYLLKSDRCFEMLHFFMFPLFINIYFVSYETKLGRLALIHSKHFKERSTYIKGEKMNILEGGDGKWKTFYMELTVDN